MANEMQTRTTAPAPSHAEKEAALQVLGIDRASATLAGMLGIEPGAMVKTMKAQCFRGSKPEDVTNEQLAALCSVASALKLNPLLPGMLYAYPDRGAIMPMIGPDGMFKLLASHPDVKTWASDVDEVDEKGLPISATSVIQMRDGTERRKTVYYSEWVVQSNPNWKTRPCHMLEIRALKQCARQVIHGLPFDEEERAIILATEVKAEVVPRPTLPPASKEAGRKAVAARATAETTLPPTQQAPPAEDPAKSPENANSGQSGDSLFGDDQAGDPGASESREVPLDGAEAAKAGFSAHDNPHVGGEARKKWLADFNAEAKK